MLHLRKRDRAAIERIETSLCAEAVVRSKRDGHARVKARSLSPDPSAPRMSRPAWLYATMRYRAPTALLAATHSSLFAALDPRSQARIWRCGLWLLRDHITLPPPAAQRRIPEGIRGGQPPVVRPAAAGELAVNIHQPPHQPPLRRISAPVS
jgi:hypothetical protein